MNKNRGTVSLFAMLFFSVYALSYADDVLSIQRTEKTITLDGQLDEAAWDQVESLPMTMHWPTFRERPTESTQVYIVYNDDYIYMGARCFDDPDGIQGPTFRRDSWDMNIDQIAILLDTFNDNENALLFGVSPTGHRIDVAMVNDAGNYNITWDSFWDAAVSRSSEGWSAEIAIPLSSLRFQTTNDMTTMGLIVYRYIARKQEMVTFPAISPEFGFWSFTKPSQAQKVRFSGIKSSTPFYVTPYFLGGAEHNYKLNDAEEAYVKKETLTSELGLDVKYGLTSNLTLDATLNTDFAQVEADNYQVNLTRFSLFFPEKRLFFQERASNFEVNLNGDNRIFHSRAIGIHEGKVVPIIGGVRLVGRAGGWDIGMLNMQTAETPDLSSENSGVYRFRRQVLNPQSYLGAITTTRFSAGGRYNVVGGLDGILRLFEYDYLTFNYAGSFEDHSSGNDNSRMRLFWEKRRFDGLAYDVGLSRIGTDYNPGLGYEQRTDVTVFGGNINHGWTPGKNASIQRHRVVLNGQIYYHNSDKHVETYDYGPGWDVAFKSGATLYVMVHEVYDNLSESFTLSSNDSVLAGTYTFREGQITYSTSQLKLLRASTTLLGGSYYDGHRVSLMFDPEWLLSKYMTISAGAEFNWVEFPDRNQSLSSHIGRVRISGALNTKLSGSAYAQYNRITRTILTNFRLRYNPREGIDLYLVYNDDLNMKRYRELPVLPVANNRTILLKFSYTFLL